MRSFEFLAPSTVSEACDALAEHGSEAQPMSGGQTLLLQMKPRLSAPKVVVHIGRLDDLRGWTYDDGALQLGAATPYAALEDGTPLVGAHELLRFVAGNLADRAVRNLGTIGGAVNAALCNYDVPVALLALDAQLLLRSSSAERPLAVDEFVLGNGVTARRPDELLEKLTLPSRTGWRWAFHKFRRRLADAATASVAVLVDVGEDGTVSDSRIVVGAVTEQPTRLHAVENALSGATLSAGRIDEIAASAADETAPLVGPLAACSADYAHQLVRTLTARALHSVAQDSRWRG